jgi:acyl carrier protein
MGMSKPTTFEKLSDILIEQLGVEPGEISADSRIIEDLGADSLDVAEIILAIEREWNMEIDDATAEAVTTVGEVIAHIDYLCL